VKIGENAPLKKSITQFNDYICAEILAEKLEFVTEIKDGISIEVNDYQLQVNIIKK
jgi:isoleucyl-tRNA synthetase